MKSLIESSPVRWNLPQLTSSCEMVCVSSCGIPPPFTECKHNIVHTYYLFTLHYLFRPAGVVRYSAITVSKKSDITVFSFLQQLLLAQCTIDTFAKFHPNVVALMRTKLIFQLHVLEGTLDVCDKITRYRLHRLDLPVMIHTDVWMYTPTFSLP